MAAVAQGIAAAMDRLDSADELRVGVLTGAGGTFCAGMDLKGFLTGDSPMVEGRGFGGLVEAPPRKPLIAAVEGFALAGGFELTLACDLVVAAEDATFGVPEVKRALVAGAGAAMLLPQRIPLAQAMELLLVGDPITSGRAAELGLVNRVVASGAALDAAVELAEKIAANGPLAVAATKQVAQGGLRVVGRRGVGQTDGDPDAGLRLRRCPGRSSGIRREACAPVEGPLNSVSGLD